MRIALLSGLVLLAVCYPNCPADTIEDADGFIVVDSLDALRRYASADNMKIRMKPGIYELNSASSRHFIQFTGDDNHWDLSGVTISASLDLFRQFSRQKGAHRFYCVIDVTGDRNILEGLTVKNHGEGWGETGRNKHFNITGSDCLIRNVTSVTSGSNPWGYGSLFGISGGGVRKMNGIRIGAPARNTRLIGARVHMRAMGHAIFVQGAIDTLIEDCHVDGRLRQTDDILAETSGYAFERGFRVPGYGEGVQIGADGLIPPNEIVSLSEDGIRMYPEGDRVSTGPTTIRNCTVTKMRRGICTGLSKGADRVVNCEVTDCIAAGFNIGSNDTLVDCRADAKYAEALCVPYLRSEGAHVDLEILDSRQRQANNLLAKINGSAHSIRMHTSDPDFVSKGMTIELASKNGYGSFQRGKRRATGVTLNNHTSAHVILFSDAVGNTVVSQGPVTEQGGRDNTIRLAETASTRRVSDATEGGFRPIPLQSRITSVQPMTGIVMWQGSRNSHTDAIQLEYSYMRYSDVVEEKGTYDWLAVERKLDDIASRKHQAILRFWDTYPGHPTGVPAYIKALSDYQEITAKSENRDTGFPDWSHPEYQRFVLEFYQKFADRYDRDPRLAFLETGFGLWSEYHVYSGPEEPGKTFPSKEFQARFVRHLATEFQETPWMISQDAQAAKRTPFASQPDLLKLRFGIFDDSFHLAWKPGYNLDGWTFFGHDRYRQSPAGGEILFPNQQHEKFVAENWTAEARNFSVTFMVCEQWPRWTSMERVKEHSLACGYKFKIRAFEANKNESRVTVTNCGVAPIYYDAFATVNGVRAEASLKHLQPGDTRQFTVASGGAQPSLTIECDRLVKGQQITFDVDQ